YIRGYDVPLIADIHFTPNAAEIAAQIVAKVRINPGNYTDRKQFKVAEYTDSAYQEEIERIRHRFVPLIRICKRNKTAIRIGVNHGSLSDRIMSRYGDTPLGMVESGMEFVRICEKEKFYNIILSMKSSNPVVMVHANRLLAAKMIESGKVYPIHLGVTEAGEGEDGRIKSAIGIGTLLEDGIGDTIRVSLTEKPENEIPVAKTIVSRYVERESYKSKNYLDIHAVNPFEFNRRKSTTLNNVGGENPPRIIADFRRQKEIQPSDLNAIGYKYSKDKWHISDQAADFIFVGDQSINFELPSGLAIIKNAEIWQDTDNYYPLITSDNYFQTKSKKSNILNFVSINSSEIDVDIFDKIKTDNKIVLILETENKYGMAEQRRFIFELIKNNISVPIIIKINYSRLDIKQLLIDSSIDIGVLLIDGLVDGIWLESNQSPQIINKISFGILQATRSRITKTEYISCPSCGRTQFDLPEVTAQIRQETEHLKGVKIGIMGCIVNGPGEMADADYGYVGTGSGTIALYKGQKVIQKNIDTKDAVIALIDLIKEYGDWVEK
ncbi:MAG: flavodoxin-dependent (E)-4-hydroxy-3-methylbut-2-enyl-diphosphate synthase, partial [Candidatus Marinimicrobia bacterium]|nr:flavodoxin-dependent (E)-4-hydroxy-3-methylbut-2-enyl-diphosphate synthase [Candidatus Neomarinimicrobiota bacterium]